MRSLLGTLLEHVFYDVLPDVEDANNFDPDIVATFGGATREDIAASCAAFVDAATLLLHPELRAVRS